MTFFAWNDSLTLGITPMDDQHKTLIALMNELYEADAQGAPMSHMVQIFDRLATATRAHFAQEEAYMASIEYPALSTHKVVHTQLLARLDESREALAGENRVPAAVFEFLKLWLTSHIAGIDQKYANATAARAQL